MKDPEARTIFAGVDGRTDTEMPEWYQERHGGADPVTFAEAIRDLPQAVETTVAYQNPYTDGWVETERFNALVEPSRARSQGRDEDAETDPCSISRLTRTRSSTRSTCTARWKRSFARRPSTGRRWVTRCSGRSGATGVAARSTWTSCSTASRYASPGGRTQSRWASRRATTSSASTPSTWRASPRMGTVPTRCARSPTRRSSMTTNSHREASRSTELPTG